MPLSWRTVGVWAFAAGILGHYFESPIGIDGEVLAVVVAVIGAAVVGLLGRTTVLDATRATWNNLGAGLVVALLAMAVAPVTSVLDVKDIVALALASLVLRIVGVGLERKMARATAVVAGVAARWLVLGSVGSGQPVGSAVR